MMDNNSSRRVFGCGGLSSAIVAICLLAAVYMHMIFEDSSAINTYKILDATYQPKVYHIINLIIALSVFIIILATMVMVYMEMNPFSIKMAASAGSVMVIVWSIYVIVNLATQTPNKNSLEIELNRLVSLYNQSSSANSTEKAATKQMDDFQELMKCCGAGFGLQDYRILNKTTPISCRESTQTCKHAVVDFERDVRIAEIAAYLSTLIYLLASIAAFEYGISYATDDSRSTRLQSFSSRQPTTIPVQSINNFPPSSSNLQVR